MRRTLIWLALLWGAATPAGAQQAMSKSMLECAVIYDEMTNIGTAATATPERRATLAEWSGAFAKAAADQARVEGITSPGQYLRDERQTLKTKWQGRFRRLSLLNENKDWIDYCRKFGKAKGILPG